ncbi:outer membrane beta-barrel family protein [Mucilaginibacter aquaedulcis]|uniref:outer membrane beta-barrel family protein n=1 Tax=Mucilaginibacter aquaedulcis TaxID=1187081 RepID=UPI0025B5673B|nr:outer membrane beta-barrel family protein [Mucilaginibacter aquaedulcis]MDN3548784.1 outer membrane beta-barrel family protein [Mucilaginibacter aquaedulcis]
MKNYFVIFFLFMIGSVFGQASIRGKVLTPSKVSLKYATVQLKKDSAILFTTSTDSSGRYELVNVSPGRYTIKGSYLTYEPVYLSFKLVKDTVINIGLQDSLRQLKEVTILAQRPSFVRKDDRFIFTPTNLLSKGSNALEVMEHTPLINYDRNGDRFSILNKKDPIIYINNVKSSLPKQMIVEMLKALPAGNIKSVEIITNPGSEYDANSTNGIININIKKQLDEGWHENLSLVSQQGKYNTSILNGSVAYHKNKITVQLIPFINDSYNYNTKDNDFSYVNGQNEQITNSNYRRYLVLGGGLNFDYAIDEKDFLSYKGFFSSVTGNSNSAAHGEYFSKNTGPADSAQTSPTKGHDTYIYNFGNINYHRMIDTLGKKYLDFNIDYNQYQQVNNYTGYFDKFDSDGNFLNEYGAYQNHLPQHFFNLSEKLEFVQPVINKSTTLSTGIQYSNTTVHNDLSYRNLNYATSAYVINDSLTNSFSYKENYFAAFAKLSTNFNKRLSASLGLRLERSHYSTSENNKGLSLDTTYSNLFPSFSLSYSPDQSDQFGISFTRKINRPNIALLFPGRTYVTSNYFTQNNPFLLPIIYNNAEFTYTLKNQYNFIIDYSHGANNYGNFTIPVEEDGTNQVKNTYLNYGSSDSYDFTINLNQTIIKKIWDSHLTPSVDYSLYHSKTALLPESITNVSFHLTFDNSFYLSQKHNLTGSLTFNYSTPYQDISVKRTNPSSHLDFGLRKAIGKYSSISLYVYDIYAGSAVIKEFQTPNAFISSNYIKYNSYSRSISLSFRSSFGNAKTKSTKSRGTANNELRQRAGN